MSGAQPWRLESVVKAGFSGDDHDASACPGLDLDRRPSPERRVQERAPLGERLLSHWYRLRGLKGFVTRGQIEPEKFGDLWGNCFIIGPDRRRGPLTIARVGRLPSCEVTRGLTAQDAAMLLDWILELAGTCFTAAAPMVRREFFPDQVDGAEYSCVVVPLTDGVGTVRSVLGLIEAMASRTGSGSRR